MEERHDGEAAHVGHVLGFWIWARRLYTPGPQAPPSAWPLDEHETRPSEGREGSRLANQIVPIAVTPAVTRIVFFRKKVFRGA